MIAVVAALLIAAFCFERFPGFERLARIAADCSS